MRIVLDASVTLAWCFGNEGDAYSDGVLEALQDHDAIVPALWCQEVANVLLSSKRRKRIDSRQMNQALKMLSELPIEVVTLQRHQVFENVLKLADRTGLTVYDATYFELSHRLSLPIASHDEDLRRVAAEDGLLFMPDTG